MGIGKPWKGKPGRENPGKAKLGGGRVQGNVVGRGGSTFCSIYIPISGHSM